MLNNYLLDSVQDNVQDNTHVHGITIVYDTMGNPEASPLLLIAGLGNQLISWPTEFCEMLTSHGYWILRFDNRDAGLSTKFSHANKHSLMKLLRAYRRQETPDVPYRLEDMAADAAGLLDYLGIASAHILGGSLGGMIALMMAIQQPQKIRTLTILSSTAYDSRLAPMRLKALVQFKRPPQNKAGFVKHIVNRRRTLRGKGFPFDEKLIRDQAARLYDRDHNSGGASRQLFAVIASARHIRNALHTITVPTLVIHGSDDPLLPVKHGIQTARAIPGAKLHIVEGLGHELPAGSWHQVAEVIAQHAV